MSTQPISDSTHRLSHHSTKLCAGEQVQEAAPEGTDKWHGLVDMASNTASVLLGQHNFQDAVQLYAATSTRC